MFYKEVHCVHYVHNNAPKLILRARIVINVMMKGALLYECDALSMIKVHFGKFKDMLRILTLLHGANVIKAGQSCDQTRYYDQNRQANTEETMFT